MMLDLIAQIGKKIESVNELLEVGEIIRLSKTTVKSKDAILTTVVDKDEFLVGIGQFERVGDCTPYHRHAGVTQYLMQYRGKCSVDFENGAFRVIDMGDCVKIKPNELHRVTGLTPDAELVFVCIPAEPGYKIDTTHEGTRSAGRGV